MISNCMGFLLELRSIFKKDRCYFNLPLNNIVMNSIAQKLTMQINFYHNRISSG